MAERLVAIVRREGMVVNVVNAPPLLGYRFDALIVKEHTRQ